MVSALSITVRIWRTPVSFRRGAQNQIYMHPYRAVSWCEECPKPWDDSKEMSPETSPKRQHTVSSVPHHGKGKIMAVIQRSVIARDWDGGSRACMTLQWQTCHYAFPKPVDYTIWPGHVAHPCHSSTKELEAWRSETQPQTLSQKNKQICKHSIRCLETYKTYFLLLLIKIALWHVHYTPWQIAFASILFVTATPTDSLPSFQILGPHPHLFLLWPVLPGLFVWCIWNCLLRFGGVTSGCET